MQGLTQICQKYTPFIHATVQTRVHNYNIENYNIKQLNLG